MKRNIPAVASPGSPGRRNRHALLLVAALLIAALCSCRNEPPAQTHVPGAKPRQGVAEVEPLASERVAAGQTIYVPAYSSIYTSDRAHRLELAITLSIRNTDQEQPIIATAVRYYDHDGQLARDYLKKPLRLAPMAAAEFFVKESDTSGGVSSSFLVEWVAEERVDPPVVETVMISTASTQGVSFCRTGTVLSDRSRPADDH